MRRIAVKIKVENLMDVLLAERGELSPEQIRSIEIDALVDTGATLLCLPSKTIADLGLSLLGTRTATTARGSIEQRVFRGAQLSIMRRTCTVDIMELQDGIPALVGYIPLENLDLQPDVQNRTLVPSRGSGNKMVMDLFLIYASQFKWEITTCPKLNSPL
ncbi:MAG: aspartyl protease family protein [bacterium]